MSNTDDPLPEFRLISSDQVLQYRRIPALAVHWRDVDDLVLIGGGGGTKGTGVQSGIVVNKISSKGALTPIGFFDTRDKLVMAISAHPNDPILACAVVEYIYIIRLVKTNLRLVERIKADYFEDNPFVACVNFSPSGTILASGGQDCAVRTFSYPSFSKLNQFKHHHNCIQAISFNCTSTLLAVASKETFFSVWHADHSKMFTLSFRNMEIRGCAFSSHQDQILYTWMNDRQFGSHLAKWDVDSGMILNLVRLDEKPVTFGRISDDGSAIAVTTLKRDCTVYTFDTRTLVQIGKSTVPHDFPQTSMDFSPIGDRLISVSADMSAVVFRSRSNPGFRRSIFLIFFIVGVAMALFLSNFTFNTDSFNKLTWRQSIDTVRNWYDANTGVIKPEPAPNHDVFDAYRRESQFTVEEPRVPPSQDDQHEDILPPAETDIKTPESVYNANLDVAAPEAVPANNHRQADHLESQLDVKEPQFQPIVADQHQNILPPEETLIQIPETVSNGKTGVNAPEATPDSSLREADRLESQSDVEEPRFQLNDHDERQPIAPPVENDSKRPEAVDDAKAGMPKPEAAPNQDTHEADPGCCKEMPEPRLPPSQDDQHEDIFPPAGTDIKTPETVYNARLDGAAPEAVPANNHLQADHLESQLDVKEPRVPPSQDDQHDDIFPPAETDIKTPETVDNAKSDVPAPEAVPANNHREADHLESQLDVKEPRVPPSQDDQHEDIFPPAETDIKTPETVYNAKSDIATPVAVSANNHREADHLESQLDVKEPRFQPIVADQHQDILPPEETLIQIPETVSNGKTGVVAPEATPDSSLREADRLESQFDVEEPRFQLNDHDQRQPIAPPVENDSKRPEAVDDAKTGMPKPEAAPNQGTHEADRHEPHFSIEVPRDIEKPEPAYDLKAGDAKLESASNRGLHEADRNEAHLDVKGVVESRQSST